MLIDTFIICEVFIVVLVLNLCFGFKNETKKIEDETDRQQVCFKEIGCLDTPKEWYHKSLRPTNPSPFTRHSIKTEFVVYTKENMDEKGFPSGRIMLVNDKSECMNMISDSLDTKILIHDFTSNGDAGWMKRFMKAMLEKANWNMIVVDWESGATPPFSQAASNARVVALEISYMLGILKSKFGLSMRDVHLIGHGLGAHVASYVGENTRGIGRITGLDPSGPYFEGMPPCVRLDPTDAIFVDVIHTDVTDAQQGVFGIQGALQPMGHVDFYPNGGYSQPGCRKNSSYPGLLKLTRNSLKPGQIYPGCSHKRSSKYFTETIMNLECPFVAFPCENYTTFKMGACYNCGDSQCSVMGLMADAYRTNNQVNKKLFLATGSTPYFCMYPYEIIITLAHNPAAKSKVEGYLTVKFHVKNSTVEMILTPGSPRVMEHGTDNTFLVYNQTRLSHIDGVEIKWVYKSSIQHTSTVCFLGLCNDRLYVSRVTVIGLGYYPPKKMTSSWCNPGKNYTEVAHDKSASFLACPKFGESKQGNGFGGLTRVRKMAENWYNYD